MNSMNEKKNVVGATIAAIKIGLNVVATAGIFGVFAIGCGGSSGNPAGPDNGGNNGGPTVTKSEAERQFREATNDCIRKTGHNGTGVTITCAFVEGLKISNETGYSGCIGIASNQKRGEETSNPSDWRVKVDVGILKDVSVQGPQAYNLDLSECRLDLK